MDFANLDGLLCSDNTSNHNNSLISAYDLDPIPKSHGFKLLDKKPPSSSAPTLKEDDFSKGMQMLLQQQRSNCTSVFSDSQNMNMNMLSFSSPNREWNPPFPYCSRDTTTSTGYGVRGMLAGVKGPFTPSQWMELEHQALIYKYITVNAPIPTNLLIPIRKALETAAFCSYPATNLRHTTYGWGGFHMGFSNSSDPEPGRCRRTDGKKWRCSRDAVADQKYCERHMNRGRHRSRKPVEPPPTTTTNTSAAVAAAVSVPATVITTANAAVISHLKQQNQNHLNRSFIKSEKIQDSTGLKQPAISIPSEFGFVSSDSLLNPLQKPNNGDQKPQNSLHQFIDDWPHPDRTQLSISIPMSSPDFISSNSSPISKPLNFSPLRMGLGVCNTTAHNLFGEMSQPANRIPVSWETSSGGPLGEVLNHNANNSPSALNLMTNGWENSHQQMALSPTGVLQKTGFGCFSNSSAGSSPRTDNSLLGSTLITSSLPLL